MPRSIPYLLMILVIQLLGTALYGQQTLTLNIKLISKEDNMPVTFAKISLTDDKGKISQNTLTDTKGLCSFTIADSLNGKLKVTASAMGFMAYTSPLIIFRGLIHSDTILLEKKSITLNEVKIIQQQVTKDGEKLIYRPKFNQFSNSTASIELFSKLPGVSLVSGKLKLNGNDGVLVLIDGKGELISQSQQLEMLSGISADKIERIEIISTASSRYDANITSVINIITKKDRGSSTFRANVSQPLYMDLKSFGSAQLSGGASTNLNFKIDKIRASLVLIANNNRRPEESEFSKIIYNLLAYQSKTRSVSSRFALNPNLTFDYDINSQSSLGINADISIVPSLNRNTLEEYTFMNYYSNAVDSTVSIGNSYNNKRSTVQISGNYRYLLNATKNSNFYLNLIYSHNPYSISNVLSKFSGGILPLSNEFESNTNIINISLIVSDLIKSKKLSSEFGLKSNSLNNGTQQVYRSDETKFDYSEQLSSAFVSIRYKFGNYLLMAGIRGELLNSTSEFNANSSIQKLNQDYFKIYPNFLLQKELHNGLTASIGYSKKIRRPFISELNPTSQINNFLTSTTGNIAYKPVFSDRIEAQFRYKEAGLTLFYDRSSSRPVFLPTSDPFIFQSVNLNRLHKFAVSVNSDFKIGTVFSSSLNVNYSYSRHEQGSMIYFKNGLNLFEISGSGNFELSKKTQLQADFYYCAKMNLEYSIYSPLFSHSLTLRQLVLRDKLSINISVNDPLGLEKASSKSYYENQYLEGRALTSQRTFSIQLVYNFPFGQKFRNQNYKKKNDGEIRDQQ
ncbi:outer membrane beta-barrel protein [Pedobacter miscanthi]|uniref:outer membrane beta-barrel protein n=1 Tax=Pedobacter miscanthi TaxID=2259170 RepID=UPI00292FF653|nr:outer membrane beta-barrel protein [Pedobacter miscanthi]